MEESDRRSSGDSSKDLESQSLITHGWWRELSRLSFSDLWSRQWRTSYVAVAALGLLLLGSMGLYTTAGHYYSGGATEQPAVIDDLSNLLDLHMHIRGKDLDPLRLIGGERYLEQVSIAYAAIEHGAVDCGKILSVEGQPSNFWSKFTCLREEVRITPMGNITRIIHQSWKDVNVPARYLKWQLSWTENHPGWKYVMWDDKDNFQMVAAFYPWFLDTYEGFPRGIQRADAARYLYMHLFGGMYVDLDFRSLRPMGELLSQSGPVVLGAMATEADNERDHPNDYGEHNIPNAWFASAPGQNFWLFCLQQTIKRAAMFTEDYGFYVEATTGPMTLYNALRAYRWRDERPAVTVLPPPLIFPLDWRAPRNETCIPEAGDAWNDLGCTSITDESYAVTYWLHTW